MDDSPRFDCQWSNDWFPRGMIRRFGMLLDFFQCHPRRLELSLHVERGFIEEVFAFRIGAFTFGGVRDVVTDPKLRVGVGADVTFYEIPDPLKPIYGSSPLSFHVFLRFTPGKMEH